MVVVIGCLVNFLVTKVGGLELWGTDSKNSWSLYPLLKSPGIVMTNVPSQILSPILIAILMNLDELAIPKHVSALSSVSENPIC